MVGRLVIGGVVDVSGRWSCCGEPLMGLGDSRC